MRTGSEKFRFHRLVSYRLGRGTNVFLQVLLRAVAAHFFEPLAFNCMSKCFPPIFFPAVVLGWP